MAEWLVEAGIGETRAALVADGAIVAAAVEADGGARVGAIVAARLDRILVPGRRGRATFGDGEAIVEPLPPVSEGAGFLGVLVREPIGEAGAVKRARLRPAPDGAEPAPGPALIERVAASGIAVVRLLPHQPDALEAAGWSELIDEAARLEVAFQGGGLRLSLTPAMTLIDVDGSLDPAALAVAGAAAAARTIRRMGIGGSIGIDLPTVADRAARQAAAAAIDAVLPQPYERTAVNGFGFVQIVRPRPRPSLPELLRDDGPDMATRALLRRAERTPGRGAMTLVAAPVVTARLAARRDWTDALARRIGASVALRAEPGRPIWAGDVERAPI